MYELHNGDCLEVMKEIQDESIDMILCDLPYGTTDNKWDSIIPFESLWDQYERIIKRNGAIVLFSQMPFTAKLAQSNPKLFRYEWIWQKDNATGFLNARKMPLKAHENILVFYKKLPTYNPQMRSGFKPYKTRKKGGFGNSSNWHNSYDKDHVYTYESKGERYPIDILFANREVGFHPTQKPVTILEYMIKTYTNEGETVLDNCMGSGSTGVACVNTNRRFIGIELDTKYFDIAKGRIESVVSENKNSENVNLV